MRNVLGGRDGFDPELLNLDGSMHDLIDKEPSSLRAGSPPARLRIAPQPSHLAREESAAGTVPAFCYNPPKRAAGSHMAPRLQLFRAKLARRIWLWLVTGSTERYEVYLPPYPMMLEQDQLEACRVVCHRKELLAQLSLRANSNVAEIGVLRGDFSRVLLEQLRPAKLHLFDLDFKGHRIAERFASEIAAGRVHLHEGDSSRNMSAFPKEYFDAIYIDGDHSYEGVVKDIEASAPRLAAQGYLILNDYTCWSPCENMQYGVMPAVNEFCRRENWEATHFALDGYMYCDLAIRRRIRPRPDVVRFKSSL